MRVVLVNPNTTRAVTELLLREARAVAFDDPELIGITAPSGVPAIDSPQGVEDASRTMPELLASAGNADAGIIGGFVDPGLAASRSRLPFPVVGMGEASMLTACQLSPRFAVVTVGRSTAAIIEAMIEGYGLGTRVTAVRGIDSVLADVIHDQHAYDDRIVEAALEAVRSTGAGAVVLGGAMFAGMARRIASRIPVPVLDPMASSMLQAQALARLRATARPSNGSVQ